MAEPDNVIVFKATKTPLQVWPSEWGPPPGALVFAGHALPIGLWAAWFFIVIPFLIFLWLISGLVALSLPFDPDVDLGNCIAGTLLSAGIFVCFSFVLPQPCVTCAFSWTNAL